MQQGHAISVLEKRREIPLAMHSPSPVECMTSRSGWRPVEYARVGSTCNSILSDKDGCEVWMSPAIDAKTVATASDIECFHRW